MRKPAARDHTAGACEKALRDLLITAAAPDNLDAFLRRIIKTLCQHDALGPDAGLAVVLRCGKNAPPAAVSQNFTNKEMAHLDGTDRTGSKFRKGILAAGVLGGETKGCLLARFSGPASPGARQLLKIAAKTISGRLAQESRERQLTRERDIADAITHLEEFFLSFPAASLEELSRTVLDEARRLTGSSCGFAGYINPDTGWLNVPSLVGGPWQHCKGKKEELVFREFTGLWGWALKSKKPLLTNCAATDPRGKGATAASVKIKQFAAAPAISGKKLIGLIALANPPADYTPAALDAVNKLARVYAMMLSHKLAEQRQQADDAKYKSILDNSSDLIFNLTVDGKLLYSSRAVESYGYTHEDVQGRHFSDFVHPGDKERLEKIFSAGMKAGRSLLPVLEYRMLKKDGSSAIVEQKTAIVAHPGAAPTITGVVRDVTASRRAAEQITESELKYKTLFEKANAAIMLADAATGAILDANTDAEKLTGRTRKELIGLHQLQLHPPEETPRYKAQFRKHALKGLSTLVESEIIRKDGKRVPVQISASKLVLGGREVMQGIFHDVSAQRNTERTLHDIINQNPLSVQLLHRNGRTLSVNAAHTRIFGSVPPADYSFFADEQLIKQGFGKLFDRIKKGETVHLPPVRYNAHNSFPDRPDVTAWIQAVAFPLRDNEGKLERFVLMHEDISERMQAEIRLQESEEKYKALVETTGTGFLILDERGKVIDANKEYLRLAGRAAMKEILGRSVLDWTAGYDLDRNNLEVLKCLKEGQIRNLCVDYTDKKGRVTPVEINATVVKSGSLTRIVSLCRDITGRKLAEDRLRESEEQYRLLFENMINPAFIHGADGVILAVNKAACLVYGYTKAEFSAMTAGDIELPEEATNLGRRVAQLLSSSHVRFETRHRLKNGSIITVAAASQAVTWEGRPATLSTCRNITEQKRAETALREGEEKYRRLVENLGKEYFFYRHNTRGIFDYISPTVATMLGYSAKEFLVHYSKYLTKNPRNKEVIKHTRLSILGIQQPPYEAEIYHKDGTIRWLEVTETPLRDTKGKVTGVEGLAHDISERKRLEDTLKESEIKYRALFETSRDALMTIKPPHWKFSQANNATLKMFGWTKEKDFQELTPWGISPKKQPDGSISSDKAVKMLNIAVKKGSNYFEWEHMRRDGSVFAAEVLLTLFNIGGKRVIQSCVRDISARKRTEATLQESKNLLEGVVENIPMMIFLKDAANLKFEVFNRAGEELLGYDRKTLIGKSDLDLFPPDQAAHFMANDREVLNGKTDILDIPVEPIQTGKKGPRLLHTRKVRIKGPDGNPKYLLGISEDITEYKKMEKELATIRAAEALSKVARPIAHDFNNALAAINGYATMIDDDLAEESPIKKEIAQIIKAVTRAAALTSKLQDFARNPKLDELEDKKE